MTVRLTVQTGWYWDAEFIGFFIASHLGLYERAGLEVTFLEGGATVTPERVLLDGAADVAITVRDTTLSMIAAGADLEVIGAQYMADPLAVIIPAERGIAGLHELAGFCIAVPAVSKDGLLRGLERIGAAPDSVRTIDYDGTSGVLLSGEADAVVGYTTTLPVDLAEAGLNTYSLLLAPSDGSAPQNLIVTRRSRSATLSDALERWMRASAEGWRHNVADPARFPKELRSTWFANTTRPVVDEIAHNIRQLEFMGDPESYLKSHSST